MFSEQTEKNGIENFIESKNNLFKVKHILKIHLDPTWGKICMIDIKLNFSDYFNNMHI